MAKSNSQNIFSIWLDWHFYEMSGFLFKAWQNYILFSLNYFSFFLLLKSLFSPWKKYRWNYPKWFEFEEFFTTLVSNIFSRFLGAIVRIFLIIIGIPIQLFVVIIGFMVLLLWILLPLIIISGILFFLLY